MKIFNTHKFPLLWYSNKPVGCANGLSKLYEVIGNQNIVNSKQYLIGSPASKWMV